MLPGWLSVGTWAVGTPLLSGGVWVFAVAGGGFLLLGCGTSLSGIASAGLRYCPWLVLVGWLGRWASFLGLQESIAS